LGECSGVLWIDESVFKELGFNTGEALLCDWERALPEGDREGELLEAEGGCAIGTRG